MLERTKLAPIVARSSVAKEKGARELPLAAVPAADLRPWFSPIEDQGSLGSCTANAAVSLVEYFERRTSGRFIDASRLFVYKTERDLLGWIGDTGAYLRTAMEALVLFGTPPERYWPYDGRPASTNTRFDVEPTSFCYAFGNSFKAMKYFRLDPGGTTPTQILANIRLFVAAGFPSMFGFPVYTEYDAPLNGGLVPFPGPSSHYRGGHANVVAGFDDNKMVGADKGALLIRNSWGTGWGDSGYGWMSYRYVTEGLAVDWWSVVAQGWVNTGVF
jgi:C1A family cysteine protease